MEKILSFSLFEARYSSHFSERLQERIIDLKEISLDTAERERIEKEVEMEVGKYWKQLLINSIIKNTERRILNKIKLITYPQETNVAVPISFVFLDFKGKSYPIELTCYSTNKNDGENSVYKGSQIWASVGADTAWTLKVFDKTKSLSSISSNLESGTASRFKGYPFEFETPGEDYKVKFEWDPESSVFKANDEEEVAQMVTAEKAIPERKTLSPGDKVGLIIKGVSPERFTRGVIKEITNMGEIKDKHKIGSLPEVTGIKLSFLPSKKEERFVSNGREIPYVSTLKGGSRIELDGDEFQVLGPEGGKPLVASEPSIINSGKVQTWVERVTSSS